MHNIISHKKAKWILENNPSPELYADYKHEIISIEEIEGKYSQSVISEWISLSGIELDRAYENGYK